MKIVQALGWFYPDSVGGTENYVAALSRQLRANGHDVAIAAPDPTSATPRRYEHDGFQVFRYPIPPRPTRDEAQGRCRVRGVEHFDTWIRRERPDLVHMHTFVTGLGLDELIVARDAGAATVVTTHSASLGYLCQRGTMMRWGASLCDAIVDPAKCAACALQQRGVPKPVARALGHLAAKRRTTPAATRVGTMSGMAALIDWNQSRQRVLMELVDRFVVLTRWGYDALAANGAPRHKLMMNRLGVDGHPEIAARPPAARPVKVGYLGRFEPIKGAHVLARAIRALPADCGVSVEFRGPVRTPADEEIRASLRHIVRSDPRVRFEPEVPPDAAPRILAGYDVLVCPSLVVEGGPTVALEAMAVGTPVIGSAIGGLAEIVIDRVNGRLVPPGDVPALASVLADLATDPHIVDRWRQRLGPVRTMADVARDYLALYDALVPAAAHVH